MPDEPSGALAVIIFTLFGVVILAGLVTVVVRALT